jgi:MoaA/NifB/PqqE/SkfB family radical SAM enzyme
MKDIKLQTCPYITCIYPHTPSPVVYVTDPRGTEYPYLDEVPEDAKFGVINLDRTVIWRNDIKELHVLEFTAPKAYSVDELIRKFSKNIVEDLQRFGWLKKTEDLCKEYYCRSVQIEITSHCNSACKYCPVSIDPKPIAVMSMDIFSEIIKKVSVHKTIRYVTFHFFNEPTLDPYFEERLKILRKYNMKLALYTNGSALIPKKIDALRKAEVVYTIIVNFPSLDKDEFSALTQSKAYDQCIKNIEYLSKSKLPIKIAVNGKGENSYKRTKKLRDKYAFLGIDVFQTNTCDRAGTLNSTPYGQKIYIDSKLSGCCWPVNHPHFAVNGDIFLCCNDYYQTERFGNIKNGSLHEIMTTDEAVDVRRKVFGVIDAPENFVCRRCHDQTANFKERQFRPLASFPLINKTENL